MENDEIAVLSQYYLNQSGFGNGYYNGQIYQKGYGVGSFLGGNYMQFVRKNSNS